MIYVIVKVPGSRAIIDNEGNEIIEVVVSRRINKSTDDGVAKGLATNRKRRSPEEESAAKDRKNHNARIRRAKNQAEKKRLLGLVELPITAVDDDANR